MSHRFDICEKPVKHGRSSPRSQERRQDRCRRLCTLGPCFLCSGLDDCGNNPGAHQTLLGEERLAGVGWLPNHPIFVHRNAAATCCDPSRMGLQQLMVYFSSLSATRTAIRELGNQLVQHAQVALEGVWGDRASKKHVVMPLHADVGNPCHAEARRQLIPAP